MAGGLSDPATAQRRPLLWKLDEGAAMSVARRMVLFIAAVGQLVTVVAPTATAHDRRGPVVTPLARFWGWHLRDRKHHRP